MEQLRLESKLLEEKNLNESLQSYTSTISHEFRTPISTVLMFLDMLLTKHELNESSKKIINLIISQLNLLLCLVNDILVIKMIQ